MSKSIFINHDRDGYSPEQCHSTMTVGELIDLLRQFPMDAPVYIRNDNGYTYSSVQEDNITDPYDY